MGQTIAEKLLSRHNLTGEAVRAGDLIEARIDGAMCHYHANEPMMEIAEQAGFKGGLPRVWDPDRVFVLLDHHQPALSQALADSNALMRKEVARLGITTFHDAEPGIAHQMMADYGLMRPGELVVGKRLTLRQLWRAECRRHRHHPRGHAVCLTVRRVVVPGAGDCQNRAAR